MGSEARGLYARSSGIVKDHLSEWCAGVPATTLRDSVKDLDLPVDVLFHLRKMPAHILRDMKVEPE